MVEENTKEMKGFLEKVIPEFMKKGKIPGLSIAVIQNGEVTYSKGMGARNRERNLPATSDTLYCIGSCTKSFIALAIMQLVEEGRIKLDDPVDQYLPFELVSSEKPITIHHLLTHSSGIPSLSTAYIEDARGLGEDTGIPWGTVSDFYRHVNGAEGELKSEPGKHFFYLNAGYSMLGHIIQKVTKKRYDTFLTENIFDPLDMKRTTLSADEYEKDTNKMTPYLKKPNGEILPKSLHYPIMYKDSNLFFASAAGGILSSPKELTKYLTLYLNKGNFGEKKLLRSENIDKMLNLYIERPQQYFGKQGYGYGWNITEDFLGYKLISHGGSIMISTAYLAFIPNLDIGVAMAANTSGFPYSIVVQGIFAVLMGKEPEEAIPALKVKKKMEMLTGTYETYKGLTTAEIVKEGGLLYMEGRNQFMDVRVPLIPQDTCYDSNRFYIVSDGIKQPVRFVIHAPDKIDLYVERNLYHKVAK
ncbi:MAG: serine hydrolase [Candidatus Korarchaeota archaeon]|nr:serine hydrolase [Candidatus Korarchaeota archaeon]NIU84296.1 serine hydrolase [Candidatus Thorarchaeota archaeon]NIW15800.1 serine hydrolase [Candidatus Thorarchaeota archaeon]NIW53714.1 serine hydrolase [Candidatus Korarchaeota archaeon]